MYEPGSMFLPSLVDEKTRRNSPGYKYSQQVARALNLQLLSKLGYLPPHVPVPRLPKRPTSSLEG
jgi:hypothetical protein